MDDRSDFDIPTSDSMRNGLFVILEKVLQLHSQEHCTLQLDFFSIHNIPAYLELNRNPCFWICEVVTKQKDCTEQKRDQTRSKTFVNSYWN